MATGHAHAQGPVDEDLQLSPGLAAYLLYLLQRQLTGQDHPGKPQVLQGFDPGGVVDGHLSGGHQRQVGTDGLEHLHHGQVLDDDPVGPGFGHLPGGVEEGGQLLVPDEGVEGHVYLHPPAVAVVHRLREAVVLEIVRVAPGVEGAGAQIDRVRAAAYGGYEALFVSGRSQYLHGRTSL